MNYIPYLTTDCGKIILLKNVTAIYTDAHNNEPFAIYTLTNGSESDNNMLFVRHNDVDGDKIYKILLNDHATNAMFDMGYYCDTTIKRKLIISAWEHFRE
jgi:hypothetical protein